MYKDMAAACEVHHVTVSVWLRDPTFRAEVNAVIRGAHPILIDAADNALLQLAVTGNLAAYGTVMGELRARRLELAPNGTGAPGQASSQNGVNIFVGIPQREPFESLPPPRTLPAVPVPTPAATTGV